MEAAALANVYAKVKTMAEAATKLPVKTEKSAPAACRSDNWAAPFESLRREIDRLFDDFHPFDFRLPSSRSLFARDLPALRGIAWPIAPAMDLVEKANGFEITAELPGIGSARSSLVRSPDWLRDGVDGRIARIPGEPPVDQFNDAVALCREIAVGALLQPRHSCGRKGVPERFHRVLDEVLADLAR